MPHHDPRVDAYIAKSATFAQPILNYLREVVHAGAPEVVEEIKWSRPFFVYRGIILGNVSAFKQHCSFGLWGSETAAALREDGVLAQGAMGSFGRITSVKDLPSKTHLVSYIRKATQLIDDGSRTVSYKRPQRVAKAAVEVPEVLAAALKKNKAAAKAFEAMTPSCRREYSVWIGEAKREETRDKRLAQAMAMIVEGKHRNWKYETR